MKIPIRFTLAVGFLIMVSFVGMQCATTGYRTTVGVQATYSSGHANYLTTYGEWVMVEPYGQV